MRRRFVEAERVAAYSEILNGLFSNSVMKSKESGLRLSKGRLVIVFSIRLVNLLQKFGPTRRSALQGFCGVEGGKAGADGL